MKFLTDLFRSPSRRNEDILRGMTIETRVVEVPVKNALYHETVMEPDGSWTVRTTPVPMD